MTPNNVELLLLIIIRVPASPSSLVLPEGIDIEMAGQAISLTAIKAFVPNRQIAQSLCHCNPPIPPRTGMGLVAQDAYEFTLKPNLRSQRKSEWQKRVKEVSFAYWVLQYLLSATKLKMPSYITQVFFNTSNNATLRKYCLNVIPGHLGVWKSLGSSPGLLRAGPLLNAGGTSGSCLQGAANVNHRVNWCPLTLRLIDK